uniref:Uncharacterized protein n=1 Tax=Trichogramma kaykai TaxID=54128 RepID=A0ABD2WMA7_9HYME
MFSALGIHKITHRTATRSAKSMGVGREARVRQLTQNMDLAGTSPRASIRAYKGTSFAVMFSTRVHNGQSWVKQWSTRDRTIRMRLSRRMHYKQALVEICIGCRAKYGGK